MTQNAASTSLVPILIAAAENLEPAETRLLSDDFAQHMLPVPLRAVVRRPLGRRLLRAAMDREGPGIWNSLACRKRYFDDRTGAAIAAGIESVVVLGAGLDTRAMRLAAPAGIPSFEVDQPVITERKRQRINLPDKVIQVPIDFETDDLRTALRTHGYDAGSKTLFLWEGVTQYLTERAVRDTLTALAEARAGSILVFSHVRQDFIDGTDLGDCAPTHRRFVGRNPLWQFGLQPEDVAGLLIEYGWIELEQVGGPEYAARFLTPIGRAATVPDLERCVTAAKR
ncbi:SAM-dependent methyltransferase [Nocardia sp. NBC_00511]|uniref:SAM-dependent methyltransferase n=1 Tax=Nocardia sp. NBC_00511 TaxID=2903591 RepID=UPI0030E31039